MPEIQALNSIKEIVGLGAGAMMLTVVVAMFLFLRSQDKNRTKAIELDAQSAERVQDLWQQTFAALNKAQNTKEQLDRLGDAQDTAIMILNNYQTVLNGIPSLVRGMSDGMETFQNTLAQVKDLNIITTQHFVDFMQEQSTRFNRVDEKVDTIMDSNARLVILLERLNANLERLNNSLELLGRVSSDIKDIKSSIIKTVTSEHSAVEPDSSESIPKE